MKRTPAIFGGALSMGGSRAVVYAAMAANIAIAEGVRDIRRPSAGGAGPSEA